MAGLINHLKVRTRVGRGRLSFPVVKAAEKWRQQLMNEVEYKMLLCNNNSAVLHRHQRLGLVDLWTTSASSVRLVG